MTTRCLSICQKKKKNPTTEKHSRLTRTAVVINEPFMKTLPNVEQDAKYTLAESEGHSVMSDSETPWTIQSMELSRSEYWGRPSVLPSRENREVSRAHAQAVRGRM